MKKLIPKPFIYLITITFIIAMLFLNSCNTNVQYIDYKNGNYPKYYKQINKEISLNEDKGNYNND